MSKAYADLWKTTSNAVYLLYGVTNSGRVIGGPDDKTTATNSHDIGQLCGTTFCVSPRGLFLTATHVLDKIRAAAQGHEVFFKLECHRPFFPSAPPLTARMVESYPANRQDIALLRADTENELPFIPVRTGPPLEEPGFSVAAFGYPLPTYHDVSRTVSAVLRMFTGIVSSIVDVSDSGSSEKKDAVPVYEMNTQCLRGMSGGPLVSLQHKDVVGVIRGGIDDIGIISGTESSDKWLYAHPTNIMQATTVAQFPDFPLTIGATLDKHGVAPSRPGRI